MIVTKRRFNKERRMNAATTVLATGTIELLNEQIEDLRQRAADLAVTNRALVEALDERDAEYQQLLHSVEAATLALRAGLTGGGGEDGDQDESL